MKNKRLRFAIDVIPEEDGKSYYVLVPALIVALTSDGPPW